MDISNTEVALLSVINLFVCGVLTIFAGPIFSRFEARSVLVICGLLNSIGFFMFMLTSNFDLLILGRVINGLAQSMLCPYMLAWVNEFSPHASQTAWMGAFQAANILGGACGTMIGAISVDDEVFGVSHIFTWRHCMLFPAIAFFVLALLWFYHSNEVLDTQAKEKEETRKL